ncbi:MAG TPA: hypothetical protein VF821_34540 [Lentzea sp.]
MLPTPTAHDGSSNGISAASRQGGPSLLDRLRLLPTPTASDAKNCTHRTQRGGPSLPDEALQLQTPTPSDTSAAEHRAEAGYGPPQSQQLLPLTDPETFLPTPRATDGTKGCPAQRGSKGDLMLPSAVIRLLNRSDPDRTS